MRNEGAKGRKDASLCGNLGDGLESPQAKVSRVTRWVAISVVDVFGPMKQRNALHESMDPSRTSKEGPG